MTGGGDDDELGLAVAVLRTARKRKRADLARAMGVRDNWLAQIERGDKRPSPRTLERIVAALGVPLSQVDEALALIRRLRLGSAAAQSGAADAAALRVRTLGGSWSDLAAVVRDLLVAAVREQAAGAGAASDREPEEARRRAASLWRRLRAHPAPARRALVREAAEFQSWALCELLCEESARAAADRAPAAAELADLALAVALAVPGGEGWRLCVEAYAWAFVGNARRVANDLHGAAEAFARSAELWRADRAGDLGLLDGSRLLDLEASLRTAQQRLPEALDLLDRALAASRSPQQSGRVLLNRSKTLEHLGDHEASVVALRQAAALLGDDGDPRLLLVLRFNLVVNLCHLRRAAEAEPLLPELRELTATLGNGLDLLRLRWLEGRVAAGRGRREEAAAALLEVRDRFRQSGYPYDAALAAVELAALLARQGRTAEVKSLVEQSLPIFHDLGIHREAQVALDALHHAALREKLTAALSRRVLDYLYRARHDPNLRFMATE
jgi:transcriptional regulator with XRE-family HTH domain